MIPSNFSNLDLQSFSVSFLKSGIHSSSQEKVSAVSLKNLSSQCLWPNSSSLEHRVAKFCIKEILAARDLILKNKLASWESLDKTVDLYYRDGSLQADVISKDAKTTIPFYDIKGLPVELKDKPEFLPFFLNDSYIRLSVLDDGSLKLYISSRLHGGGSWFNFTTLAVLGVTILFCASPIASTIGRVAVSLSDVLIYRLIGLGASVIGIGGQAIINEKSDKIKQEIPSQSVKHEEQVKSSDECSAAGGPPNADDNTDQKIKNSIIVEERKRKYNPCQSEVDAEESKRLDPVMPGLVSAEERIKLGSIRQNDLEKLMEFYLSKNTDSSDEEEHPFGPMPSKPKRN